jgi:tRNA (guanine6-N2)-methyltransferase
MPQRPAKRRPIGTVPRNVRTSRKPAPPKPEAPPPKPAPVAHLYEADVAEGLESLAEEEILSLLGSGVTFEERVRKPGILRFAYPGNPFHLTRLKTVQAVYQRAYYPVPRPKALLGDQHFKNLLAQIALVRELAPADAYKTFFLSAAGSESSVMQRLKTELGAKIGLEPGAEEGDLLLRLRHPLEGGDDWEMLVRLSPRPLATRSWRVCNREGALNAAVAHAMIALTQPAPDDHFLNLMCGSGTLLIERLLHMPAASVAGYDHDEQAIICARQNVEAAGYSEQISLRVGDCRHLPLPDKSIDALVGDLPFGHLVGSHEHNVELYPQLLAEAARVAKKDARCVLITHEVHLMESLLDKSEVWDVEQVLRVALGGLYPRLFVLVRK